MNWSRAKNILIALLIVVNAFLLGMYISRDNGVRADEMSTRADVCKILSAQGISIEEQSVPLDSVEIRPAILREAVGQEAVAEALFGSVTKEEAAGSTAYFGGGGSIMFSRESFSLVYESGRTVENEEQAKNLARDLAAKLGVSTNPSDFVINYGDGGYTVKMPQIFSGVTVFDCGIEFKISESGSIIASGKLLGKGSLSASDDKVRRTSALMLSFADNIKAEGKAPLTVQAISLGYISEAPAAGRTVLAPVIEFSTDRGIFYLDMQSGKFADI